ncbi:MAG: hypothetical protein AAFY72_06205, partial [Cyanobacteria bacterium J06649_4]
MTRRSPPSAFWSRQAIHQLEEQIQAIPTWLVAVIAFVLLSILVVFIERESPTLSTKDVLKMILADAEGIA